MTTLKIDPRAVRIRMAEMEITTQTDLAARADISEYTLRRLMAGEDFRSSTVNQLANALDCDPTAILANGNK